jgi:hypothetical protein
MSNKKITKRKNRNLKDFKEEFSKGVIFENKANTIVDLTQDAKVCAQITESSCWRPDIYLDLGCSECAIQEHCACPIKNLDKKKRIERLKKK